MVEKTRLIYCVMNLSLCWEFFLFFEESNYVHGGVALRCRTQMSLGQSKKWDVFNPSSLLVGHVRCTSDKCSCALLYVPARAVTVIWTIRILT